ncbi:5-formyltetrahydrofolate cyclo-ligase [Catellatospora sp. TT07R-123]|uniref:5-formyltetrahydrofolate cyclo-ligase n=1 Tax=Catellatospora sp. TT07R-123 TaxID=2733863 RepID=UPI001B0A0AFC|nr:5-formyltetrahydrofolate cyclo-ligase [Catellatospora sp. TT07R-123]GHJ47701.1 5-formyltetrahydrofolate cyclo-ligase [Catellatospora sp. TT07R-123]
MTENSVIGPAVDRAKQAVRERVWTLLDNAGVALPPGAHGRIPHFAGADRAAQRLFELDEWRGADVVKANPDWAQHPVRVGALSAGKLLYMAVPRLATLEPFYLLDPPDITVAFEDISTGAGAREHAPRVDVGQMRHVDLVVAGSVAVDRRGVRVGKGAGYSDIEVALLTEAGLIGPETVVVTTVHQLQLVEDDLPETEHDFSVDVIVTPDEVIRCGPPRRPPGIMLDHLSQEKIRAIPALARFSR